MTSALFAERPRTQTRKQRPSRAAQTAAKAVLFCKCGREASHTEWDVEHDNTRRRLLCPDCGTVLTVR